MAERYTSGNLARRMYVPEERPGYQEYIADPENQRMAEEAAFGLFSLLTGPIGQVPRAVNLAKNLGRGSQLISRPDRGNAMRPEEMLQLEGPPARLSLPKPRQQMSEEELQAMEIARMVGEGGPSASKQAAVRRETNRRPSEEEIRANEVARMESEGGMDPQTAAIIRTIKEDRERAARAEDISRFEGEGGGAWTYTGPRYKYGLPATQGAREVMPFNPGAREMIPYGSSSSVPTFAGSGMDFLSPSMRFSAEEARPMLPGGGGGGALPPPTGGAAGASVPPASGGFTGFQTKVPYGGETANIGLGSMPGTVGALTRSVSPFAFSVNEEVNKLKAGRQGAGVPAQAPVATEDRTSPWDETNIAAPQFTPERRSPFDETNIGAPQFARASGSAGRASAPVAQQSTGADVRALWENYNKSGEAADFIRADKAMQDARKAGIDLGLPTVEGKKAGGSVEKKPDAVHKALEIIHHLVMR